MSYADMFGAHRMPANIWEPKVEYSDTNALTVPPGAFMVDPYLAGIGSDPYDSAAVVAIPSGRVVAIGNCEPVNGGSNGYRMNVNGTGKTPITLHDGGFLNPCGMSVNQMYRNAFSRNLFMTDSNTVRYRKNFMAEVPYVPAINDCYTTLASGARITGYYGSTTSTVLQSNLQKGKPVAWQARRVYSYHGASALATVTLTSANLPAFTPVIVNAWNGTTYVASSATSMLWNGSAWTASFSALVTDVLYTFGQDSDQIAGEVVRIESLSNMLSGDNFLRWVEYSPVDYLNYPPATMRYPVTKVGGGLDPFDGSIAGTSWETPSTVTANETYQLLNYPISVMDPVLIAIQGTITDIYGNSTTYAGNGASSWYVLPTSAFQDMRGYFIGQYHSVNWLTGIIQLSSNFSNISAVRATYSYIQDWRDGAAAWGAGVIGLTDGSNVAADANGNPQYGTPGNLNVVGATGALRVAIY